MKIRMIAIMLAGVLTFSGITSTAFASEACVREPLIVEMAEEVMTASEEAACTGGYTEQPFLSFDKTDFILAKGKSTVVKASFAAGDSIVRVVPTRPDVVKAVWSGRMITVSGKAKGMTTVAVKTKRGKVVKFRVTVPKTATKAVKASDLTLNKGRAGKIKVQLIPANTDETNLIFRSSNTRVCKVSVGGTVKAVGKGRTTVAIRSGNVVKKVFVVVK